MDASAFTAPLRAMTNEAQRAKAGVNDAFTGMGQKLGATLGSMGGKIAAFGLSLPQLLGITSIQQIGSQLNQTLEQELELGHLNDLLGTSVEWLSALRTVASENSVSGEQFTQALNRMNQTLGRAIEGSSEARETFSALGLDWRQMRDQGFERNFMAIADAFGAIEDRSVRARLAVELFGREGGSRMLRQFQEGGEGLRRAMADARGRGAITTAEDQQRFRDLDNAIDRITTNWRQTWVDFMSTTAPALTRLFNRIADILEGPRLRTLLLRASAPQASGLMDLGSMLPRSDRFWMGGLFGNEGTSLADGSARAMARWGEAWSGLMRGQILSDAEIDGILSEAERRQANAPEQGRRFVEWIRTITGGLEQAASGLGNFQRDIDRFRNRLEEQTQTWGLSGTALDLYRLRQAAVTDKQRAAVDALEEEARALDRLREASAQLTRQYAEGQRITDQMRGPLETFAAELERLQELFGLGLSTEGQGLTAEGFQAASVQAFLRLERELMGGINERRLPQMMEAGSAAATSLINQQQSAQSLEERMLAVMQEARRVADQTAENTARMAAALERLLRDRPELLPLLQGGAR